MFRYYLKRVPNTAVILALILLMPLSARSEDARYRYYLDASRAEEVLAGLVRPRLYRDRWLDIIGERKDADYTVKRGDTLWGISSQEFGDPFLWRKLWQQNDYLSNPHEISSGQILKYYREGEELPPEKIIRVPLVRLTRGGPTDLESDGVFAPEIRSRYQPNLLVVKEEDIQGEIAGGYTVQESFAELDEIYLDLYNQEDARTGVKFAVARFDRKLRDSTLSNDPVIGVLMRLVGEVEVVGLGENLVKAQINAMRGVMQRGDKLLRLPDAVKWSQVYNPPDNFTTRIVMGEHEDRKIFVQGDLVLLNKGTTDGMRQGYLFRVFRDTDPHTQSPYDVEPDFSGEIQVLFVSDLASIGFVLRNKTPLFVGDTLIANQLFADPPPPPRRPLQTFTIE